jgi:hypothetical protein
MGIDQALFEMELVGHDFFLFTDAASGLSSVVYRRRGYQYGVIRLMEEEASDSPAGSPLGTGRDRRSGPASGNGEASSASQGSAASRARGASGGSQAGGQTAADPQ